ncbi:MAG TPA: apolipoprotein N-acyltransferase [Tepidisphaeraceae bacterium]|nr:apolipoprotein N-acyltransferase [Tepidisphaeraceae bacterium]
MPKPGRQRSAESSSSSNRGAALEYRPPNDPEPQKLKVPKPVKRPIERLLPRLGLSLASIVCLTLAFAPFDQFYLAWVGLVPWLMIVATSASKRAAFGWSWLIGVLFFGANMWWLFAVPKVPTVGAFGLMLYLGLYFPVAALVLRRAMGDAAAVRSPSGSRLNSGLAALLLVPVVWIGLEWVRGTLFTGLPWLYIGHSQSSILAMCQIADLASAYGVGFWVVMVNALVALLLLRRFDWRSLARPIGVTVATLGAVLGYGLFRVNQSTTAPGPSVMVVQSNFPQDRSGAKGVTLRDLAIFHLKETRKALDDVKARGGRVDLVAWPETMMPTIGDEAFLAKLRQQSVPEAQRNAAWKILGDFFTQARDLTLELAKDHGVAIVVGCVTYEPTLDAGGNLQKGDGDYPQARRFNSAWLAKPDGTLHDRRYDKIHLVPFGEFIPFKTTIPLLYRFFNLFNPYGGDYYTLYAGRDITLFPLKAKDTQFTFVAPICFEDVDSALVARMFRPDAGAAKRADLIINITNDGWFRPHQMPQHLQIAVFRSIENRAPTARSVNTGVSAFIDPVGRITGQLPPGQEGAATGRLALDSRTTFYTLYGDLFAYGCGLGTAAFAAVGVGRWWGARKNRKKSDEVGR